MGGYGSGRSGGRLTVEDSLTLDLRSLFKTGVLKPSTRTSGTLRWTTVSTGEETASMGFQSALGEDEGYVRFHWTSADRGTGETRQCQHLVTLTTRPQPFGGRRWLFVCLHTGESATKLYLPSEAYTFACRNAYRLGYRSQLRPTHGKRRSSASSPAATASKSQRSRAMRSESSRRRSERRNSGASQEPWPASAGRR
jgi:hypothetical protein